MEKRTKDCKGPDTCSPSYGCTPVTDIPPDQKQQKQKSESPDVKKEKCLGADVCTGRQGAATAAQPSNKEVGTESSDSLVLCEYLRVDVCCNSSAGEVSQPSPQDKEPSSDCPGVNVCKGPEVRATPDVCDIECRQPETPATEQPKNQEVGLTGECPGTEVCQGPEVCTTPDSCNVECSQLQTPATERPRNQEVGLTGECPGTEVCQGPEDSATPDSCNVECSQLQTPATEQPKNQEVGLTGECPGTEVCQGRENSATPDSCNVECSQLQTPATEQPKNQEVGLTGECPGTEACQGRENSATPDSCNVECSQLQTPATEQPGNQAELPGECPGTDVCQGPEVCVTPDVCEAECRQPQLQVPESPEGVTSEEKCLGGDVCKGVGDCATNTECVHALNQLNTQKKQPSDERLDGSETNKGPDESDECIPPQDQKPEMSDPNIQTGQGQTASDAEGQLPLTQEDKPQGECEASENCKGTNPCTVPQMCTAEEDQPSGQESKVEKPSDE